MTMYPHSDPLKEILLLNAEYTDLNQMHGLLENVHQLSYGYITVNTNKGKEIAISEVLEKIMKVYQKEMSTNSKNAHNYLKQLDKPQPKITRPAIDSHKTQVQFLYNKKNEDLFAYFPNEIHNGQMNTAYSHVGQHSGCSVEYANESKQATPEQYKDLKAELTSIGYNLEIINK